ncbi:MAG: hypothetical protein UT31_C0026G0007 [Parcubacteria group bacterium GW2011_GWF2_39_13b]|nr:MAG: hypothetical protein UT31_C0026G0007 [Parcubacteria group bacterium GW2011_GWF2_39_13b]
MIDALIFQLIGLIYLAVGIGILIHPEFYKKLLADFSQNLSASYLGGIIALVIGYVLVFYHNTWSYNWPVIITIIGWMSLVKGSWILISPSSAFDMAKALKRNKVYLLVCGAILAVFGIILMYIGFWVKF